MSPSCCSPPTPPSDDLPRAVAVYCGAHLGTEPTFQYAAACKIIACRQLVSTDTSYLALGYALATQARPLVYGGGSRGIMGCISEAVLKHGGTITGVIPGAMLRAGGEGEGTPGDDIELEGKGRERVSDGPDLGGIWASNDVRRQLKGRIGKSAISFASFRSSKDGRS
jgi:hypothetical protein